MHKQLQATESQVGPGNKVGYTVDIPCLSQCQGRRHAIPTFTASTNFWRLFPLLCTEWPVVSMEIALSHWSSRVRQVEGVRPATAKKSKMKLGEEKKRRDGINFSSKGIPVITLISLISRPRSASVTSSTEATEAGQGLGTRLRLDTTS